MRPETAISALRFVPLVPVWVIAALAGIAVLVVALGIWRRARGTLLRLAAFAVLLGWLAGPRLVQETWQGLPDIGLLVVDHSDSMQLGDRARLASQARAAIAAQARKMPGLELRTIRVPEHGDDGTQLFAAIDRAMADIPRARMAGTIAITDGEISDTPKTTPGGAPLNLLIPAKGEETDRVLRVLEAPGYGIVGKAVTLRVEIEDLGVKYPAGSTNLTIRRDGQPPVVENVPIGRPENITVPINRAGPIVMEMSADKLPGEISTLNNRAVVEINGVRDRLHVLLISGAPAPAVRTWRRLLKSDPSVDLVHFTILRPPDKDDMTPLNQLALIAFPVRELFQEKIDDFDLIILDQFDNEGLLPLPYLANIAAWVRQGGALLMNVGPEFVGAGSLAQTPLGDVLPALPAPFGGVATGEFRPEITTLGQRDPVTQGLRGANPPDKPGDPPSWGPWFRHIVPTDVHGEVLMKTPGGSPLLILNRAGKGRVALLLSDQIWLWSRDFDGGGPAGELLKRVAHWLMKEPALEENALVANVANGRLSIERRSLAAEPPADVTVTDPDGKITKLVLKKTGPGRADATLPAPTPGVWKVTDGRRTAYAAAGAANPREMEDLRATASIVGPLARQSGGGVHWLGSTAHPDIPQLERTEPGDPASGRSWIGLERRHDHLVTGVSALTLLPPWAALPLLVGLMVLAWRREGR